MQDGVPVNISTYHRHVLYAASIQDAAMVCGTLYRKRDISKKLGKNYRPTNCRRCGELQISARAATKHCPGKPGRPRLNGPCKEALLLLPTALV